LLRRLSDHSFWGGSREEHVIISGQGHRRGVVYRNRRRDRVELGGICDQVCGSYQYAHFPLLCTPRVRGPVLIGFCKAWATVIHLSHGDNGPGIKLKELANKAHQPESALSGVKLLWTRRRARRAVEWVLPSLYLLTRFVC